MSHTPTFPPFLKRDCPSLGSVHEVVVLALDAVVPLDLAIPAQIFGTYEETPYRVTVCAASPVVPTTAGFSITAQAGLEAIADADTVIVPGFSPHLRVPEDRVLE